MFTKKQYEKAIINLKLGMTQLEPDGRCCVICGDWDHQAWECHHNPLSMNYLSVNGYWKCFHCNAIFTDYDEASEHFGERDNTSPICKHLCSGYGVFPDGRQCDGCPDCVGDE